MKLTISILFILISSQLLAQSAIGINTDNPRKTLEVAGDMNITQTLDIGQIPALTDSDIATFLIQKNNNRVVEIDPKNPTGTALGYLQKYVIENPDRDWVDDFDTGISATDFDLIIISAFFNKEIALVGGDKNKFSLPYTSTFVSGGTWHIIADYLSVANEYDTANAVWEISTLIYSKDLSKQFGTITIPMGGNSAGSATNPFID